MSDDQLLSDAAAIYRHQGDIVSALKLEAILHRLDHCRPVRVADLEAAEALARAALTTHTEGDTT